MRQYIHSGSNGLTPRGTLVALVVLGLLSSPLGAQRPKPPATPARGTTTAKPAAKPPVVAESASKAPAPRQPIGRVAGVIEDSIHMEPLVGAMVTVGQTKRSGTTDRSGVFIVDSVPAGEHSLVITHPLLDTLYLPFDTPPIRIAPDSVTRVSMAIPPLESLVGGECSPATKTLGPSLFAGRVLDAETKEPVEGARVTIVWTQLSAGTDIGLRRTPRVRTVSSNALGYYRICGLPSDLEEATLQAERGRVKTPEIAVALGGAPIGLRSLLVRPLADTGVTTGSSVITGRVIDTVGLGVADAQVSVEGAASVTTTNATGAFSLDSLPAGTQALVVRRLGFGASRTIVDLTGNAPTNVTVQLGRPIAVLEKVVVTARADALSKVGFEERQRRGMGRFLTPEDLQRMQPQLATSALRQIPGLRVVPSGNGRYTVQSSRGVSGGCVNFWVDGAPFREMAPGDLDATFPAHLITAIETYNPGEAPAQFVTAGQSGCTAVVMWTEASIRRRR